jgi:6-phosphogluconolactonase
MPAAKGPPKVTEVRVKITPSMTRQFAYVGTYTEPLDGPGNGEGIYLFEMNPATGDLSFIKLAAKTASPSWLTFHPSGQYLYATNEVSDFDGNSGSVSAFAINHANGDLRLVNVVSSQGAGPAHLSVDASGKYAFVANYLGGNIAVLRILPTGSLGSATCIQQNKGSLGSMHATGGPPGSFAMSGHDAPHAHMIQADPKNRRVLQTDIGQDRIYVYNFDSTTGELTPASSPFVPLPTGDGPRHFAFHPNGNWMYSIQEEASTIVFFLYDAETGVLTSQQTVSTLPSGYAGSSFSSGIMVSQDGRFLYGANRLHNSIAVFSIGGDGKLDHVGETAAEGDYPSQFSVDPDGNFLYSCNLRSDQITSFRIDKKTGLLTFTGRYTAVGTPACIAFLM